MKTPASLPVARAVRDLGSRLALARRRRGLSQDDLAQRMGVSKSTVERLEAGHPGIALQHVASALQVFGELGQLVSLLDTPQDTVGLALMDARLPKRVVSSKKREPTAF